MAILCQEDHINYIKLQIFNEEDNFKDLNKKKI